MVSLGVIEWVRNVDWLKAMRLQGIHPTLSESLTFRCCACLQDSPIEAAWIAVSPEGMDYLFCADCHQTYKDEPERAWLEAVDWLATWTDLL